MNVNNSKTKHLNRRFHSSVTLYIPQRTFLPPSLVVPTSFQLLVQFFWVLAPILLQFLLNKQKTIIFKSFLYWHLKEQCSTVPMFIPCEYFPQTALHPASHIGKVIFLREWSAGIFREIMSRMLCPRDNISINQPWRGHGRHPAMACSPATCPKQRALPGNGNETQQF